MNHCGAFVNKFSIKICDHGCENKGNCLKFDCLRFEVKNNVTYLFSYTSFSNFKPQTSNLELSYLRALNFFLMTKKVTAAITAVGGYVPPDKLTNADLEKMVETNDEWIRSRTGISERRILKGEGKASSDLGAPAVLELCHKRGIDPKEIERSVNLLVLNLNLGLNLNLLNKL